MVAVLKNLLFVTEKCTGLSISLSKLYQNENVIENEKIFLALNASTCIYLH
jgi:hypothetical protein